MREAAADTAGAVRGFFFPILIDCAGNTKGGASSPKGGKRVTARPEVPPLFSAVIRRHARCRQRSLVWVPVRRSVRRRASCLPPGWKGRDNERPWRRRLPKAATARLLPRCARLARRPPLPGPRRRPLPPRRRSRQASPSCRRAEMGRKSVPGGSAPLDAFSIPVAASAGSPQGLPLSESPLPCTARRPPPLSPGAAAAAAAATERTRPAPRARGEGAGIGGDTPSEAGGGFSLTFSS